MSSFLWFSSSKDYVDSFVPVVISPKYARAINALNELGSLAPQISRVFQNPVPHHSRLEPNYMNWLLTVYVENVFSYGRRFKKN